jgi:hypothetical protein
LDKKKRREANNSVICGMKISISSCEEWKKGKARTLISNIKIKRKI